MDDLIVLDLLDCPLCLEKLDATAKVFPCQHTFCQPCLQRLFKAKKELRCPECRTPVFCSIEDLPANLLLVRLLDGLKGGKTILRRNSSRKSGGLFPQDSLRKSKEYKANQESLNRIASKTRMPSDKKPSIKAVTVYRGDKALDENRSHGEEPALCKALHRFNLNEKNRENKDCLKFEKDDIISVIRRVDDNWAEGKLGDQMGFFPLMFVEPNHTAKHLLESNKKRNNESKIFSPLMKSPAKVKVTELATNPRIPEGRRKGPRQFLLTNALNRFNKMVHFPVGRQNLEISSPILISASNPAVIEKAEALSGTPVKVKTTFHYSTFGTQISGSPLVALPNPHQNILANMCVVLQPYMSHGPDEMDLQKGEGVRVLGKFHEGWFRGVSLVTGKIGIFPSHCVSPESQNYPDLRPPVNKMISVCLSLLTKQHIRKWSQSPIRPFVPTAVVEPMKQSSSLQRNGQNNPASLIRASVNRPYSAIIQSEGIQIFQNSPNPIGKDYRRYSAASSLFFEVTESSSKSEPSIKSPISGPPSILVKPDTPKSSFDKQVKTVRFMNFSPPPLKRHGSQLQHGGRSYQPITKQDVVTSPLRANSVLVQAPDTRRTRKPNSSNSDIVISQRPPISHASRRSSSDTTKRWSTVYYTQDILSA
ncbi:hypothetical protein GDO86_005459 [Hymenochirus boettgeri]|uniref:SH3 domain containing ring finger 2 n=1 Tax=Hymenochirus boettgeri TaxID=247094 RepID=A0A8T2J9D3_9PIPI|nr:hypothetical protein GDO86_005459 [Hymenochirus boettgeri]KAG8439241.1 hypothetical protein GDO86_005459 [Hymenochirus boettgeri]KAG8439242.1 hypothetical protein GDO86_005459 [Hymenochirus boettgeri]